MAVSSMMSSNSNSSNRQTMSASAIDIDTSLRVSILASCYSTSIRSSKLQSFHYTSSSEGGGFSGVPEVTSGYPKSPPSSRRFIHGSSGAKEASRTITRECERLLCRDMKRIFLGGGGQNSKNISFLMDSTHFFSPRVIDYIEVWDYVGEASFRGFITEQQIGNVMEKTMFLFFQELAGLPLKDGLIALIELASDCYACDRLVICLHRDSKMLHSLIRDLGWVGFELLTLSHWIQDGRNPKTGKEGNSCVNDTSDVWLFVGMEL